MSEAKLLTIEVAAEYLCVPVSVLRGLRKRRLVPVVHFGKRLYFRPEDLDRLVDARLVEPRREPATRGSSAPADAFDRRRVRRPA